MNRFIRADAFNDLQIGRYFAARPAPGGARRLDRVDRVDDDGMPQPQMFVRQRDRHAVGRDAGFSPGEAAAPHRRLDRIDREQRYRQAAGKTFRHRALAGTGKAGKYNELLRCHRAPLICRSAEVYPVAAAASLGPAP